MSVTIMVIFVLALALICALVFVALGADRRRRRAQGHDPTLLGGDPAPAPDEHDHRASV